MYSRMDLASLVNAIQHKFFPRSCELCREKLSSKQPIFCSTCVKNLPYIDKRCQRCAEPLPVMGICSSCQKNPPNFERCLTLCEYRYPISSAIKRIKKNPFAHETKQLSFLLAEHVRQAYSGLEMPKIIIPMPAHPLKVAFRGFNQSHLIAQFLSAKLVDTVLRDDICVRKHLGKPQRHKTRKQRIKILSDTFYTKNHANIYGKSIALIDDVITTGSTASAATKSLLKSGAKSVDLWCIAKTSWHNGSSSIKI